MNLFKRFLPQFIVILTLCIMSGIGIVQQHKSVSTAAQAELPRKVIIDAGHGGLTNTIMAILFETVQPHCFGAKL